MSEKMTICQFLIVLLILIFVAFVFAFLVSIPVKAKQHKAQQVCKTQLTYMIDGTTYSCNGDK